VGGGGQMPQQMHPGMQYGNARPEMNRDARNFMLDYQLGQEGYRGFNPRQDPSVHADMAPESGPKRIFDRLGEVNGGQRDITGANPWDAYNQQRSDVGRMTTGNQPSSSGRIFDRLGEVNGGPRPGDGTTPPALGGAYGAPSWAGKEGYQASPGMMDPRNDGLAAHYKSLADANNQSAISRGPGIAGNVPGMDLGMNTNIPGGGQQFSGAYAAPSWGGGQQGPLQMPGGVRDRSTMFDPSLGGKGGFSMTKGAGMASNIGDIARRFKPMSKGGYSIGEMFKPGGMTNKLLGKSGKVGAAISGAPAWAMPAAGAAAFGVKHLMKRSKQKKHQKQQNAQRDQIKNAAANGQYVTGNLGNLSGPRNY
jgi:hypothetical protein